MKYFKLLLLLILPFLGYSQNLGGLIWNDPNYDATPRISNFDGSKFSESKLKVDLKPYCPIPNNQGRIGSCVGQSVGYGAMTIMHAMRNKINSKSQITKEAFSALYIFNQIKVSCENGSYFSDAFELLKDKGDVKFNEFDQDNRQNCNKTPGYSDHSKAKKYKIDSYSKLFDINDPESIKVTKTRAILASGSPVLVGMVTTYDMRNVSVSDPYWHFTSSSKKGGGHAMVVVGYDDRKNAFELLNSWGENWGNRGYCWIKYDDFAQLCKYAYYLRLKKEPVKPNVIVKNATLSGDFNFVSIEYQNGILNKKQQAPYFNGKYYTLAKKGWGIGSQFQLIAKNIGVGEYVYVFSVDNLRNSFVHFPRSEKLNARFFGFNEAPIVPIEGAEIIIPNQETVLVKDKQGSDYLFVLFSEKSIDDTELIKHIEAVKNGGNDPITNFYNTFSRKLIPSTSIKYAKSSMSIQATAQSGFIAPIILKVD